MKKVIVTQKLQCASVALGHRSAFANITFVCQLFGTLVAAGEDASVESHEKVINDLALVDAHSAKMACSVHYNVSDRIKGGVIQKSVRSFFAIMKAVPIPFPETTLSDEELGLLVASMVKLGGKRA